MKKVNFLLRICGAALDAVIVSFPVQVVLISMFHVPEFTANFLYSVLFAIYGTLFVEYMGGRTPGKLLAKTKVVSMDGGKPTMMYIGLRELTKALYLTPVVGWVVGIACIMKMIFGNGRGFHDIIGKTQVIYVWQERTDEEEGSEKN